MWNKYILKKTGDIYEGLQLLDEQNEIQISSIEDLKKSNEVLSKPPQSMKQNKKMENQQFVKEKN